MTLYKRKEILDSESFFMIKYGSLFEEFTSAAGEFKCQYYTLFFIRRYTFIVIVLFFGSYPIGQVIVFLCFSAIVIFKQTCLLTHFKKPFIDHWLNYINALTELILILISILLIPYCFHPSKSTRNGLDIAIFILLNIIILIQMLPSIKNTVKFIKLRLNKNTITVIPACQVEDMQQDMNEEKKSNMDFSDIPMFNTPDISFTTHKEPDFTQRHSMIEIKYPEVKNPKYLSRLSNSSYKGTPNKDHLSIFPYDDEELSADRFNNEKLSSSFFYISPRNKKE